MGDPAGGRIAEDGTVYVLMPDGSEHTVGQWAAGDPAAGLAHYRRRYDDLAVELDLARKRLKTGHATPDQAVAVAQRIKESLVTPTCVGDIAALVTKADTLSELAETRRGELSAERKQAREDALERRRAIADEAEKLARSTQWKATGQRFRDLLDEWKALPRFDKRAEQAQWERFSTARQQFDKARKQHFAELDAARADAAVVKDELIRRAEALSSSTDWAVTSRAYRDLMEEWKAAPRAGKQEEDRLWAAFRGAQDKFFAARSEVFAQRNEEEVRNLEAKQAILTEVDELFPVRDPREARRRFSALMERWEQIGHVPRDDKSALDRRIRSAENKIRQSEQDHWRRTDPAARALAENTVNSFRTSVAKLEKQIAAAEAAGDERKAAKARASLESTQALLAAAEGALAEYSTD